MTAQEIFSKRNRVICTASGHIKKNLFEWSPVKLGWQLLKRGVPVYHAWNKGAQFFAAVIEDGKEKLQISTTGLHNLDAFLVRVEKDAGVW